LLPSLPVSLFLLSLLPFPSFSTMCTHYPLKSMILYICTWPRLFFPPCETLPSPPSFHHSARAFEHLPRLTSGCSPHGALVLQLHLPAPAPHRAMTRLSPKPKNSYSRWGRPQTTAPSSVDSRAPAVRQAGTGATCWAQERSARDACSSWILGFTQPSRLWVPSPSQCLLGSRQWWSILPTSSCFRCFPLM
jgi:hypothetical protein